MSVEHSGDQLAPPGGLDTVHDERTVDLSLEEQSREPVAPGSVVRFSRYLLLERVGQGGIGVVHAAYDPQLHRRVAIKFLHHERSTGGTDASARLLREAQAMARVSHRNVAEVHDVGEFHDSELEVAGDELGIGSTGVFVVMELLDGQTLGAWLRETERSWKQIVGIFIQAGLGLSAAHAAEVVHRDFKPSNVVVTPEGRVVVIDLGLARGTDVQHPSLSETDSRSPATPIPPSPLANPLTSGIRHWLGQWYQ